MNLFFYSKTKTRQSTSSFVHFLYAFFRAVDDFFLTKKFSSWSDSSSLKLVRLELVLEKKDRKSITKFRAQSFLFVLPFWNHHLTCFSCETKPNYQWTRIWYNERSFVRFARPFWTENIETMDRRSIRNERNHQSNRERTEKKQNHFNQWNKLIRDGN